MGPGLSSCEQSVGYWASEVTQWAPGSNDFNWNAGHFTQVGEDECKDGCASCFLLELLRLCCPSCVVLMWQN